MTYRYMTVALVQWDQTSKGRGRMVFVNPVFVNTKSALSAAINQLSMHAGILFHMHL